MTPKHHHPATYFFSGLALAALLSAAPVKRLFGGGIPNTFVAGTVASADEVNENFNNLDSRVGALESATGGTPLTFLGRGTSGPISDPPFVVDGETESQLAQLTITVPASGTTFVRLGTSLGFSPVDQVGRLYVNGLAAHTSPFVARYGYGGGMGLTERGFALDLGVGDHTLGLSIYNSNRTQLDIDVYQGTITAWFVAD